MILAGGCGPGKPPIPPTYPVTGEVHYADGRPVADGVIEFRLKTDSSLTTSSAIAKDGTFSLQTLAGNERVPGAVAGEYEVTVHPPVRADQAGESVTLSVPFTVGPPENKFKIVIGPPRN